MDEDLPVIGHRMVLAITEFADAENVDLTREYEASVAAPNMPWHWLEEARLKLWEALVRRALRKEVVVRGVLDPIAGAVTVSPHALQGSAPNFLTDALDAAGTTFRAVRVFRASLLDQTGESQRELQTPPSRGKGGVAPTYDWDEFVRELTRALFAGELVSRRGIKKHMTAWCSANWSKQPDETSIRNTLHRFLSTDIPEKEKRNN